MGLIFYSVTETKQNKKMKFSILFIPFLFQIYAKKHNFYTEKSLIRIKANSNHDKFAMKNLADHLVDDLGLDEWTLNQSYADFMVDWEMVEDIKILAKNRDMSFEILRKSVQDLIDNEISAPNFENSIQGSQLSGSGSFNYSTYNTID